MATCQPSRARANSALRALDDALRRGGATQLFIETPYRNEALFAAVLATCRPELRLCVAIDLSLPGEEVISRRIGAWREHQAAGACTASGHLSAGKGFNRQLATASAAEPYSSGELLI